MNVPKLTISRPIDAFLNASEWLTHVQSLKREVINLKASKVVPELTITFSPRTMVRLNRPDKFLTEDELSRLAQEHSQTLEAMTLLFSTRKIRILSATGEVLNQKLLPKQRKSRATAEENA